MRVQRPDGAVDAEMSGQRDDCRESENEEEEAGG